MRIIWSLIAMLRWNIDVKNWVGRALMKQITDQCWMWIRDDATSALTNMPYRSKHSSESAVFAVTCCFFFSNIHYVWTKRKCHFSQTNRERYTNRATVRRKWGPEHKFTRFVLLCLNTFNGFPAMFAVLISSFFVLSLNRNVNENARWKKRSVAEIARE